MPYSKTLRRRGEVGSALLDVRGTDRLGRDRAADEAGEQQHGREVRQRLNRWVGTGPISGSGTPCSRICTASVNANSKGEQRRPIGSLRSGGKPSLIAAHSHAYNSDDASFSVNLMRVTTAEFIKRYGALADRALSEPVTITKNGRDRLVLLSADEYARLKRRDRRAIAAEELTEAELELIASAEVPPEHGHLDAELADWKP